MFLHEKKSIHEQLFNNMERMGILGPPMSKRKKKKKY